MVLDRTQQLAREIWHAYEGKTVHFLCVLKGAHVFFSDLLRAISSVHAACSGSHVPYTFDFIRVKSYVGTESSGNCACPCSHRAPVMGDLHSCMCPCGDHTYLPTLANFTVQIIGDLTSCQGRPVVVVEDIVDTGGCEGWPP